MSEKPKCQRKPYPCPDCGCAISVRSKYYTVGVCGWCVRRDSSPGLAGRRKRRYANKD